MAVSLLEDGSDVLLEDGDALLIEEWGSTLSMDVLLLENGADTLLEDGDQLLLEPLFLGQLLLENGDQVLWEDGDIALLEQFGPVPPGDAHLLEDAFNLLLEDAIYNLLLERQVLIGGGAAAGFTRIFGAFVRTRG